jgi:hypothetical protein
VALRLTVFAVAVASLIAATSAQGVVRKVSLTTPVQAGEDASLTVNVSPRARCTIEVIYDTVVSKAKARSGADHAAPAIVRRLLVRAARML